MTNILFIGKEVMKNLYLSDNRLEERISSRLCGLSDLRCLHLRNNPELTDIPTNLGKELTNLTELNVSHCKLKFLPPSISICIKKEKFKLWASGNNFSKDLSSKFDNKKLLYSFLTTENYEKYS